MGRSNYIIVDNLKLIVETNREVDHIEDYEENALTKMINSEDDEYCVDEDFIDIKDVKIGDITIGNLTSLYNSYKNASVVREMNVDKFLLYWLKSKEIGYKIKSEHNIDIQQYIDNGYAIFRR